MSEATADKEARSFRRARVRERWPESAARALGARERSRAPPLWAGPALRARLAPGRSRREAGRGAPEIARRAALCPRNAVARPKIAALPTSAAARRPSPRRCSGTVAPAPTSATPTPTAARASASFRGPVREPCASRVAPTRPVGRTRSVERTVIAHHGPARTATRAPEAGSARRTGRRLTRTAAPSPIARSTASAVRTIVSAAVPVPTRTRTAAFTSAATTAPSLVPRACAARPTPNGPTFTAATARPTRHAVSIACATTTAAAPRARAHRTPTATAACASKTPATRTTTFASTTCPDLGSAKVAKHVALSRTRPPGCLTGCRRGCWSERWWSSRGKERARSQPDSPRNPNRLTAELLLEKTGVQRRSQGDGGSRAHTAFA